MPELRQNLATREWVIIASERARRPNVYAEAPERLLSGNRPTFDPGCPFCPGNEELDLEVSRHPAEGSWQARVVRNKYPALAEEGPVLRRNNGVVRTITGVGYHEIIVETPLHNTFLGLMDVPAVTIALQAFLDRGRQIAADPRMEQIVFFKNHGERAGASLAHAHSQVIGLPIVPGDVRHRIEEARRFFDDTGQCVFCTMLEYELAGRQRVIAENEKFVAFVLYASSSPFHIWIMPRDHRASFLNIDPADLPMFADIVRNVLHRLYTRLNDPDYNLVIRSTPVKEPENGYFHWYMAVVPRLSRTAGFELGSGVWINPTIPEDCAAFLRD
ncbi:MAG: HIT domain-containing protein [Oscillochloris sp.]|nr:HIT domain-containing protein [Oscillochloris sp.]